MKTSYIDYAMSVIVGRALPDVRDGLKPVHRRILFAMHESGITSTKPYKKSARVVGDVLGKFHPHGDVAVYDAMVRMAQDFSLRYMLIDGQGNFGSVDGDSPAAMRYTESRLNKMAEEMLEDIDKNTVNFDPNYDESLKEPKVLPAKLPNLLINGSSGIAVGMATNMPPHNISEIIDGITLLIDNPDTEIKDIMKVIKAPDFPTGGIICGINGVISAYTLGRGLIRVRAKTSIEEGKRDKQRIIVTEIPYQVNKSNLLESIANLVKEKKVEGITDLRDESDRTGMRIVIELRRDSIPDIILKQLYKHTQMQTTFGIINLALVNNQPKILSLPDMIHHYISHRKDVVRRRTQFELDKAEKRAHILEGLIVALDNIDEVIKIIRKSKSLDEARESLKTKFLITPEQTKAILDMRLQKLTGLERQNIKDESGELKKKIARYKEILASETEITDVIKEELTELKKKYGDTRRTEIDLEAADDFDIEELIPDEEMVVTITNTGYIKRLPLDTYKTQKRGGVGLIGMGTKEEDYVVDLFVTSTHNYILFFSNRGKVYWLKTYKIPVGGRHAKGKAIINLLPRLEKGEVINAAIPIEEFTSAQYLTFVTKKGQIKKTVLKAYGRPMITGIRAIRLREGDELVETKLTNGQKELIIASKNGQAVRFHEKDVRPMGRAAMGVRGIRLKDGDEVVGMSVVTEESILLTITENGYGKRSEVSSYRKTRRGAGGVITIKTGERNGKVVGVKEVSPDDELIVTSQNGMIIRMPVRGIRVQGRATMGVRVMKLKAGDRVVSLARLVQE
ncbi:MAG: DNA gyrase subunit A [Methanomassiliicoccales archaeon]|nr:MAG: DNA gyrase subunit A [Methanomassiliicoccales archaeon]